MGIEISVESDEGVMDCFCLGKGNRATIEVKRIGTLQVHPEGTIYRARKTEVTERVDLNMGQSWTIDADERDKISLEVGGKRGYKNFDDMEIRGKNWSIVIRSGDEV